MDVIVQLLKYGLVLGLIVAWASIIVPPIIRFVGGRVGRGADSVLSFRSDMDRLGGRARRAPSGPVLDLTQRASAPGAGGRLDVSMPSRPRVSARKRRRDILVGLLATTGVLLLGALALGGIVWYLFGLSFLLLGAYVAMLWTLQQAHLERQRKVAYLPNGDRAADPAFELRRVGSGRV